MSSDVTRLLQAVAGGDRRALQDLVPLVYEELRGLAGRQLQGEKPGHTLQPTALVHEAFLRLTGNEAAQFNSRAHFFGAAARAMRRILVEQARAHARLKRTGDRKRVTLAELSVETDEPSIDLLALDEALDKLAEKDARLSELVQLRYFVGLSIDETAQVVGRSTATVKRDWQYARAWLFDRMDGP